MADARERLREQHRSTYRKLLFGIIIIIFIIVAAFMIENSIGNQLTDFSIEKSKITDEQAIFIPIEQLDTNIIAVKASDGTYRLAFDDCMGCYYQYGKHARFKNNSDNTAVICDMCGCEVLYDDMGQTEECRPYPIEVVEIYSDDINFVLSSEYLSAKKELLEAWRSGSVMGTIEMDTHRSK